ncbi:MAG TPA: DNA polymerase I [Casimicrobiaceae bacterium]|nr:DNA polymerase I [Casimicrobiaceae bacterium]
MATLVLVDGSSYLYRAFHALPDLRTASGEPTGALRGVLSMLRRIAEDEKPDYFAVVFDAPGKTFRDEWYPEYKANRTPMPDDLARQIQPLHELIRANGWPLLMIEGVEADDVIGTLTHEASAKGLTTTISTGDKDLAQLVRPGVKLVNTMSNETLDEAGVLAKFGVRADQVLDLLTLTGDAIDNVPGVAKVGPKTAAKWLAQYGTLDGVIAHAGEITGVVGDNLRAALDWLPQGRRLLTVKTDCTLPVAATDLLIGARDAAKVRTMYERYGFKQWLKDDPDRDSGNDAAAKIADRAARENARTFVDAGARDASVTGEAPPPVPRHYEAVLDAAALERWVEAIERADVVCVDTETTSIEPMQARIVGLAFAIEPGRACYIPLAHRYPGAPDQLPLDATLARLAPWFANPTKFKIGQNLKYDQHVLANHGIALAGIAHDTLLQSYVLEAHRPHDMDSLAWRHLNVKTVAYADVAGKGAKQIEFDQVDIEGATRYSAEDADIALQLHRYLYPRIAANPKLERVYATIEMPVREVLYEMERAGVMLDTALLAAQSRELGEKVMALEREAYDLAGHPFNLSSPKQLGEILFERMKLPSPRKTATGQPSTDEDVLTELAANYPLPKRILEHRALSKLKSTYTDKLPSMVNPRTGRVHTTYSQATAVTGRLASTDPNLQNIPVRTAEGRRIREAFIAPPGHVIVSADYSQIELRIMAHLSADPALVKAFRDGADIHRATAAEVFGVSLDEVTTEQRRYIKAVNFGLIYGMSAFGLAQQLGIERSAASQFIERYFQRYPGVAAYMQATREFARERGYVETVFGRRLWLSDIKAGGGPRRAAAERAAINAPMQGTAADLVKLAMIAVHERIRRDKLAAKLLLQVHDELVLEVPERELDSVRTALEEEMTGVAELSVPLVVDVGAGRNWEKAH